MLNSFGLAIDLNKPKGYTSWAILVFSLALSFLSYVKVSH